MFTITVVVIARVVPISLFYLYFKEIRKNVEKQSQSIQKKFVYTKLI